MGCRMYSGELGDAHKGQRQRAGGGGGGGGGMAFTLSVLTY